MAAYKQLSYEERCMIEDMLNHGRQSIQVIAKALGRSPSTITREIRNHLVFWKSGSLRKNYNPCIHRNSCERSNICSTCRSDKKWKKCRDCKLCTTFCPAFEEEECRKLTKTPYVCNGCGLRINCRLEKRLYKAKEANEEYREVLSESRSGISYNEDELREIDEIVSPLLRQNQSPHHICATNRDSLSVSERTIYRLIDSSLLSAGTLDLPRKVRYRPRKKSVQLKVDKKCRIGRSWQDYQSFLSLHPFAQTVELDSVIGKKGGKVLLTVHFPKAEMMLAFLRDHNDSGSVIEIIQQLYSGLGSDTFKRLFWVCLADNGSEFSNPKAIEFSEDGSRRSNLFYCDPQAPQQKGSAERNHEFIRNFIPKGTPLEGFTQEDISLMMDHINSYSRESLGDKCPYDVFRFLYGPELLDLFSCNTIPPQKVKLNNTVFTGKQATSL